MLRAAVGDMLRPGYEAAADVLYVTGLAYPNPISSYLWVCYLPMMRTYLSTYMGAHVVERYLRIMGENSTSGRP